MDEIKKSYYAIIPANVRYDKNLTAHAKLLYGEITALCNEKGFCWASNQYFSELYGKTKVTISSWIKSLKENGYIDCEIIYKQNSKEIQYRKILITQHPIKKTLRGNKENFNTPIKENFKDNNTLINNTMNNKEIKPEYTSLARLLYILHKKHDDKFLHGKNLNATLKRWANDIRLLIEKDGRTVNQVRSVIEFCQSPGCFWISNILSGKKLREKFPVLISQMKNINKNNTAEPERKKETCPECGFEAIGGICMNDGCGWTI